MVSAIGKGFREHAGGAVMLVCLAAGIGAGADPSGASEASASAEKAAAEAPNAVSQHSYIPPTAAVNPAPADNPYNALPSSDRQPALAPTSQAEPSEPPVLNPTNRVLEMTAPLNYRNFYLGDLEIRIRPDQRVEIPREAFLAAVKPLLRETAFETLSAIGAVPPETHYDIARLPASGFDVRFDPGAVAVIFAPTLDQKVEGNISVQARKAQAESPNAVKEAELAGYLNLRAAVDYIGRAPSGDEGLKAPRLDLEAAARWQGVVIEAEATYEPDDVSLFGQAGQGFKRRGTRLVRDFEEEAVRVSAGDVYPIGSSFQYTPDLLGVSIERSYGKLQPGRNIRATSRRSFRIERPSSVDVQVNGLTVRRLRLDPGDYNVKDLPIGSGLNDLVLLIEDDAGNRQRLEFTLFLDNDLLAPDLSEWAFAAGIPSRFEEGEPDYGASGAFLTGFYRRGLSETLTAEIHFQGDSETVMGGAGFLIGSPIGLFSLESAASFRVEGMWGVAFSGDYALANIEDSQGRRHSFRLSADARTPDFTPPAPAFRDRGEEGADRVHDDEWLTLSASYGTELPFGISAFLSGGYGFGLAESGDSYHADLSLTRALNRTISLGMSAGYSAADTEEGEASVVLRLQYRPDRESRMAAAHDSRYDRSSLSYSRQAGQGVGSWRATVDLVNEAGDGHEADANDERSADNLSITGSVQYTGNRANLSLFQDSSLAGLDMRELDQRTSLRLETAIAYADGHVAVGRPVSNGFAIVAPHAGLADNRVRIGRQTSGYVAHSDFLGPALMSGVSPYAPSRVEFDVDDLPPGYDLGDGLFDLMPKYKSGYALKVGSEYAVTVLGDLVDAENRPLPLMTGVATEDANPEKRAELFTNRAGRFTAQGLSPGRWTLELATEPKTRFRLDIPAGTVGLFRAGTLRPI